MQELSSHFSWDAIKFDYQILACCILIWLAVVACAISSVVKQAFSWRQKTVWIGLILVVPVVGLLAYLPFSVRWENHSEWFGWRPKK